MTDNQLKELITLSGELFEYDKHFELKYELIIKDDVKFEYHLNFYSKFKGIIELGFDKLGNDTVLSHKECIQRMKEVLAQCEELKLEKK